MAHYSGKTGNVFIADLLLEDCEDSWTSGAKGTAAAETTIIKVGTGSAKCTIAASPGTEATLMYETMGSAKDVSGYTHILCWAYSSVVVAANDYRIGLGTAAAGATPTSYVTLPAIAATTWTYLHCAEIAGDPLDDTSAGTIICLWTWINGTEGDIIYLDDVRAAKNIAGIKSWTLDYTVDMVDTSDFVDGAATNAARTFLPGLSTWSGSFEGFKDGAPLTLFAEFGLQLAETSTATQTWIGHAVITGCHPSVAYDGAVTYSYDFEGTGELQEATA